MKKNRIYLRTGIGLFLLFLIVVYLLTEIQSRHISNDMQISFHSNHLSLLNDTPLVSDNNFKNDYDISDLMFSVNYKICGVGQEWARMNLYSSILLIDSNREVITRSGDFLQCSPYMIPLDKYCSVNQINQIYKEFYSLRQGSAVFLQGDFYGYLDKWGFVPQKFLLSNQEEPTKNILTLKFDNLPDKNAQIESLEKENAIFWVQSFGSRNRMLTEKDRAIIKECEDMAFEYFDSCSNIGDGGGIGLTSAPAYFDYRTVTPVKMNGETCYLLIGVQGFPKRDAIKSLMPTYIFLFGLMLILFFMISRSFIKIYKQQVGLESSRQDLINAVAHELKTPLGVIRSFCEGLKEKINEDKKEHYLDVIQDETNRMEEIVSEMLALSQLESGIELTRHSISLKHIAEQALAQYQEAIAIKSVIAQVVSPDNCMINCDAKLIKQVILNFLSNAVHHTPENGNINISITDGNGKFIFTIENTGQHIPADKINHIWDAYYKIDTARSNPKGTGLGLAIVKSILTAHRFEYGVANTESGVKFWFITPRDS